MHRDEEVTEREQAELAALADGTLPAVRRRELEERVAASPRLQALLAEQRRALAVLRARDERAPHSLRRGAPSTIGARHSPARHRVAFGLGAVAAAAGATALAIVVLGSNGTAGGTPTVSQVARLAALPATSPEPVRRHGSRLLAGLESAGLRYPDLAREYGWSVTGSRGDRVGDRDARTVFYSKRGRRVGYTIVSGPPLRPPPGARAAREEGNLVRTVQSRGGVVATWRRRGHTCVLAGVGVRRSAMVELAGWDADGHVPF